MYKDITFNDFTFIGKKTSACSEYVLIANILNGYTHVFNILRFNENGYDRFTLYVKIYDSFTTDFSNTRGKSEYNQIVYDLNLTQVIMYVNIHTNPYNRYSKPSMRSDLEIQHKPLSLQY